MKLEGLRQKLLRSARRHPPSDHVPYAFEQRVLHSLRTLPRPDPSLPWVTGLWRAAACALAVTTLLGAFHWRSLQDPVAAADLPPDRDLLELAVLSDLELATHHDSTAW
jgi:hypothetical protein